jgi:ankyrin repeat protein
VEALIEAGADIRTRLQSGFTPLLFAARDGRSDVAAVLLKSGADVNDPVPGGKHLGYGGRLPPSARPHCSWP